MTSKFFLDPHALGDEETIALPLAGLKYKNIGQKLSNGVKAAKQKAKKMRHLDGHKALAAAMRSKSDVKQYELGI